jgi:hypothetical protein
VARHIMGVSPVAEGSSAVPVESGPGSENLTRLFLDFGVRAAWRAWAGRRAGEADGDCLGCAVESTEWLRLRRVRRTAIGRSKASSILRKNLRSR